MPEATDILFAWAHLANLHVGAGDTGEAAGRRQVLAALREDLAAATARGCPKLDALFLTGDVARSGAEAEYREAREWLTRLAREVGVPDHAIHVVPGTHDVLREVEDRSAAQLATLRAGPGALDESLRRDRARLARRFVDYLGFAAGFAPGCADLFWVHRLEVRGLRVRVVGFNTALLAAERDVGKLRLGAARLVRALDEERDEELVVMLSDHASLSGRLVEEPTAEAWIRRHAPPPDHASGAAVSVVRLAARERDGGQAYSVGAVVRSGRGALAVRTWPRRWSPSDAGFRLELGTLPAGAQYAQHALRSADPGSEAARFEGPGGVPAIAVPHFVGRDDDLRALQAALLDEGAACVVCTGPGGVGTTSLLRQLVATEAAARFPDGAAWIDARDLDAGVARVCARFGFQGECQPTAITGARFLARALHERRVLLVIDDVPEAGLDPAALPILGGASRTVLTSRGGALPTSLADPARRLELGRWSPGACRAYLVAMAAAAGDQASAGEGDLEALAAFVDHLPLGVKLVARLLARPGTTPARLLARLAEVPPGPLDDAGAGRGLAAVFQASHAALDGAQRRVLGALGFVERVMGGARVSRLAGATSALADTPPDAMEITGDPDANPQDVGEVLAALGERSLLDHVDGERGLWAMHEVVRRLMRAQPSSRHADGALLAFAREHVMAHQDPLDWQALEVGTATLVAAVDRALDTPGAVRPKKREGGGPSQLVDRGRYGEIVARYERLAASLPEGLEVVGKALGEVGLCYLALGDHFRANAAQQRARAIEERLGR